jgi:hypothetical protein
VAKRKTPRPEDVGSANVYAGAYGFRYTLRGLDKKVIYDSPHAFKSRYLAKREILKLWPGTPVSFG